MIEGESNGFVVENGENKELININVDEVIDSEDIQMNEPTNSAIEIENVESEIAVEISENSEFRQPKVDYDHENDLTSQEIPSSGFSDTHNSDTNYFNEPKLTELSRYSWRSRVTKQRFLKGCLWSPDGTCILTTVNCDGMHVIEMPRDLYEYERIPQDRPLDVLQSAVHVKEGGLVYDYCWYPFMNSNVPTTCW